VFELLRFLYTDEVHNIEKIAMELLYASDKYIIPLLKSQCQVALAQSLDIPKCCEILSMSYLYSATELKTMTIQYIVINYTKVKTTIEWQMMEKNQPHLCYEVLKTLMASTEGK